MLNVENALDKSVLAVPVTKSKHGLVSSIASRKTIILKKESVTAATAKMKILSYSSALADIARLTQNVSPVFVNTTIALCQRRI
jgi:hypothetical protein